MIKYVALGGKKHDNTFNNTAKKIVWSLRGGTSQVLVCGTCQQLY